MPRQDNSVKQQVKNGLLIAAEIVGGMLVFVLAAAGMLWLFPPGQAHQFPGPLKAWLALSVAGGIIYWTAERWAGVIPGLFLIRGLFRGLSFATFASASDVTSRLQAAEVAMYSLCVIGFLWRFIPPRHTSPTTLDRFALTIYAFSVAAMFVLPQDKSHAGTRLRKRSSDNYMDDLSLDGEQTFETAHLC
ncbi:MAG TPA: hypothetical protein VGI13_09035 [Candidatus Acidoferrum sp.]|jgi:hypothetical protein